MEISEMQRRALEIRDAYRVFNKGQNDKPWGPSEYMSGFVGDVGSLSKLIMMRQGYRAGEDVEKKLSHELADCLWSVLVLADELSIDIEKAFGSTMDELANRF